MRSKKDLNNNYEDYESMRHISRSGYGFFGGILFLLGAFLLRDNNIFGFLLIIAGIWLFWYGYRG